KTKIEVEERMVQSAGTDKTTTTITRDGGFSFGIIGLVGFNYFVAKNFAFGAEYSLSYNYLGLGGNYSEVTRVEPLSGSTSSTVVKGKDMTKTNTFDADGTARILLSYYF